jgi:hypothetical protein
MHSQRDFLLLATLAAAAATPALGQDAAPAASAASNTTQSAASAPDFSRLWSNSPSRFDPIPIPMVMEVIPVMLPPGWSRLETRPVSMGSAPRPKTIGIVVVAAFAARTAATLPDATRTATPRSTRSLAPVRKPPPVGFNCYVATLEVVHHSEPFAKQHLPDPFPNQAGQVIRSLYRLPISTSVRNQ